MSFITINLDEQELDLDEINNSKSKIILIIPAFIVHDLSGITRDIEKIITYYIPQHYDISNIYKTINSLKVELKYLFISNDFWYKSIGHDVETYKKDIITLLENIDKKIKLIFIDKNKY